MVLKVNPKKLNPLQAKTLTILQVLAVDDGAAQRDPQTGRPFITNFPSPHGHHFHVGPHVVSSADATGLRNEAVWVALERKGLAESRPPFGIVLTEEGMAYDTGLKAKIFHGSDH
jgi:hypothetical protein